MSRRSITLISLILVVLILSMTVPSHAGGYERAVTAYHQAEVPESEEAASPGYRRTKASFVTPTKAQRILDDRSSQTLSSQEMGILSATEATPEIQELARGLNYDPDLIYEHVYNYIEYTPIYGSVKGASGTLSDGRGNDFDQASLMIALLREAGYSADYVYGVIRLNPDQITNWLGIDENVGAIGYLLGSAGIPCQPYVYSDGTLAFVDMDHVWVKVDIGGTDYVFDPSFKHNSYAPSIDLASAMGYDQSAFLSSALSGATTDPDYVQNISKANLSGSLTAYATNLVSYIDANMPAATLAEIIGGKTIDPLQSFPRQTSLTYQRSITEEWTDIPAQYKGTLRIQHLGIDETFYSCDIYGKRLTIFYNGSNQPVLRLDGADVSTGYAATPGTYQDITLTVDHPYSGYGGTYCDDTQTFQIKAGGSYLVVNGWSETRRGTVDEHRRILRENVHAGGSDSSEPVLGESLAMIGYTWLAECSIADELADQLANVFTIHHHMLGVCGQNESPYIDMPMCLVSVISSENDSTKATACFFNGSGHHSAFEWGVIDQLQPHSAVSTVKLMDISNAKSDKIFDATSANYYSAVKPQLVNYDYYELSYVEAYIDAGYRVILPEDGNLSEGDWTGIGFLTVSPSENQIGHIISGGLSGGFGITDWDLFTDPLLDPDLIWPHEVSAEPIDLVTGGYLYDHTDMTVGSQAYPFGLSFERSYNSSSRLEDGPLGLGWTHNLNLTAIEGSDGFQGLGEDSPTDAAAAIVEHYVSIDLLQGSKTNQRVSVATLAHRWFMDRLIDNAVTISEPGITQVFVRLPDNSYNPPPGDASTLSQGGDSSYLLQMKHGELLDFDTDGRMATWTDTNGNTVVYSYNGGRLQSVSDDSGHTLTLAYDGDHVMQVSDGTGRDTDYSYDAAGNLTSVTDCSGNTTTYQYAADGMLARIYYPANPANPFVTNTYDPLGKVETQTDGRGNTYHYHFSGYRAEEANPLGDSHIWYFNSQGKTIRDIDALGNETHFAYDGQSQLVLETYPEGNSTQYEYDGHHNLTKEILNPKPGSSELPIQKLYIYELTFNKIETVTGAVGNTTTFTYDGNGNLTVIEQPEVDGSIPTTSFTHNGHGQVATITDPEGMATGYIYDPTIGDLLYTIVDQGGLNLTTQLTYDTVGNTATETDPRGNTTTFQYDNMRRPKQVTAPSPFSYVTKYTYDPDGKLTRIEKETGDAGNPWQTTTMAYTLTGKEETVTDPQGHVTTYQYDQADRLWKVTDAENRTTEYLFDATGRLYRVMDAKGNTSEEHAYTSNGSKRSLKDANGNTTLYEYDDFDRPYRTVYPDLSFEEFSYDAAGNLLEKRTRDGEIITYGYDPLDRLITKALPGPEITSYTYDLASRLVDVTDSNGTIHYTYDPAGGLAEVAYPGAKVVSYQYDTAGNRSRLTYPDGYFLTYNYDELNRLTTILEGGVTTLAEYEYDALSRCLALTLGNGTSSSYTYEIDNDLTSIQHQSAGDSVNLSYTYDDVHGRTSFAADDNRFIYFPTAIQQTEYVGNELNQYTSVDGTPFTYDGNGSLTSDGVNTYAYDAENHLVEATTPSRTASYVYDPFGRRSVKDVDGQTTAYLYDGNEVIMECDGSGQILRRYVNGLGIDEPICMTTAAGSRYYYHFDGLGSVVALTGVLGDIVEIYGYDPYGFTDSPSVVGNPYLYTGRQYDSETGLYYYRARYYDPALARFLQVDPIGYLGGMNLYAYCGNTPVNLDDPSGTYAVWDDLAFMAAGGLGGIAGQAISDLISGERSSTEAYWGAFVGGAISGEVLLYTANPWLAGAAGGAASSFTKQSLENVTGKRSGYDVGDYVLSTVFGGLVGWLVPTPAIPGVTSGQGSFGQVTKRLVTELSEDMITRISLESTGKMFMYRLVQELAGEAAKMPFEYLFSPSPVC